MTGEPEGRGQNGIKVEEDVVGIGKDDAPELSNSNGAKAEKVPTAAEEEKPNPSKVKELWGKLGLDVGTVMMMFKSVYELRPDNRILY